MNRLYRLLAAITLFFLLITIAALPLTPPALAHGESEIGPYVVITGWEIEPPIVGERNAIVFEITENGQPVTGLEASLKMQVSYAGRTFLGNLEPTGDPGHYRTPILPTVRGQYEVQLTGNVAGVAINGMVEPEEVLPASLLQFPEAPADNLNLADRLGGLADEIRMVQGLAIAGIILGLISLILSGIRLRRRR